LVIGLVLAGLKCTPLQPATGTRVFGRVLAHQPAEDSAPMLECFVNNEPRSLDSGLKTWGDVLSALQPELVETQQSVTAVRFDGVDQPSFGSPEFDHTPLSSFASIEVETRDRTRVLQHTLTTAVDSLPRLAAACCRTAAAFRGSDLTDAHRQLSALVECVRTLTMLTIASAAAAGTTLDDLSCGPRSASHYLGDVAVALDTLAQWQNGREWQALADALENELAPGLLHWSVIFEALRPSSGHAIQEGFPL
jgi:hypothetical protein